jgi:hypothetical protein
MYGNSSGPHELREISSVPPYRLTELFRIFFGEHELVLRFSSSLLKTLCTAPRHTTISKCSRGGLVVKEIRDKFIMFSSWRLRGRAWFEYFFFQMVLGLKRQNTTHVFVSARCPPEPGDINSRRLDWKYASSIIDASLLDRNH